MREFTLRQTQTIERPIEEVFAFFANAKNLGLITPPWLQFKIASDEPIVMRKGTTIDYVIRLHGIPLRWRSEITVWEPSLRFVDEQRKGPYRYWIHEHRFEDIDAKSTRIHDDVRYSVLGGGLVNRLFVEPDLKRIFKYRADKLAALFDADTVK